MFESGTLWDKIRAVTDCGLQSGVLQPIPTACRFVEDSGVRFLVRVVDNLARKHQAAQPSGGEGQRSEVFIREDSRAFSRNWSRKTSGISEKRPNSCESGYKECFTALGEGASRRNPFLPYDDDLYVADASETHVCLLNKFNVVDHHLLIVTRRFEQQELALTLRDFDALCRCMAEYDGLGFYNSGTIAGASQPHKHLQFVPLPLVPEGPRMPIESLLPLEAPSTGVGQAPSLAFRHALVHLDSDVFSQPTVAAARMLDAYQSLLQAIGIEWPSNEGQVVSTPYNLLITRQWMMAVPRTRESFESISFNSLAFAGALLVRRREEMEMLESFGPMNALRYVTE